MTAALLQAEDVAFGYGTRRVLEGVSLTVRANECLGLVGPNGAGKTTLLRILLGLLRPERGSVTLCGDAVARLSRRQIAQRAALVPQDSSVEFPFTVREVVAMGRNPYLGRFRPEGPHDMDVVSRALAQTETEGLADRFADTLSGGERQRVLVARALAQETPLIFLDEPTASLDLVHQLEVLELVRGIVGAGRGAVAALHDLSLASRYCDRILILHGGRIVADGPPAEVVTEANLARYFRVRAQVRPAGERGGLTVVPLEPIQSTGDASGEAHAAD